MTSPRVRTIILIRMFRPFIMFVFVLYYVLYFCITIPSYTQRAVMKCALILQCTIYVTDFHTATSYIFKSADNYRSIRFVIIVVTNRIFLTS